MEEKQNVRRRIVRRRNNGGATGTGNDGTTSSNPGADNANTIGSRNGDNVIRVASDGESTSGQDNRDSESDSREIGISGSESERNRNIGGSGSNERNDDDGIQFATDFGGPGSRNSRSTSARGTGEGKPKRIYRKRQKSQDAVLLKQDEEDLVNIVVAVGDGLSNATGFEGFQISQPEAGTIARPAARILQRHGALAETVRSVADPLALIIASATVFGPRIAGYRMFKQMYGNVQPPPQENPANEATGDSNAEGFRNNGKVVNLKDVTFANNDSFNR